MDLKSSAFGRYISEKLKPITNWFSELSSIRFNRPKSISFLLLFIVVFSVMLSINFYVYNRFFSYSYGSLLTSLFQFQTDFFDLFLLLPFSVLFSTVFVVVLAFSGSFEDSDGYYAAILAFISTLVLSIVFMGSELSVVLSSFFLALAIPYAMLYLKKRIGLFNIRQLFWKSSYILFITVSLALGMSFLSSFLVAKDQNIAVTKQAFVDAPAIGTTSGLDALKFQLRQAYEIGFMEGVDYHTRSGLTDFERQIIKEEARDRAEEILETSRGVELLGMYAEQFPYFDILIWIIPIFISAAIFSLTFTFFTLILRPICVVLSLIAYERLMSLYVKLNF